MIYSTSAPSALFTQVSLRIYQRIARFSDMVAKPRKTNPADTNHGLTGVSAAKIPSLDIHPMGYAINTAFDPGKYVLSPAYSSNRTKL
jgi:hypothetical protein